ncbi:hypothetical protein JB92DRAFT_3140481 [Gautieria morchelliformis]|nr:hypothetical protein JB92DRAFT_3140481 [Gautieria morchelliformis]
MGVASSFLRADNFTGIARIEVILDSEDYELARDRLTVKISEMFYSQSDRRFAFDLLMTQTTCTVYMFDHSGAVASQPFNYHQRPVQFYAIMFRLGCDKRDRLGFDQSTSFDVARREVLVRTRENSGEGSTKETFYNVSEILFHSATLIGRGVCRLARKEVGHPKSNLLLRMPGFPVMSFREGNPKAMCLWWLLHWQIVTKANEAMAPLEELKGDTEVIFIRPKY